jgi:hypothetical protein
MLCVLCVLCVLCRLSGKSTMHVVLLHTLLHPTAGAVRPTLIYHDLNEGVCFKLAGGSGSGPRLQRHDITSLPHAALSAELDRPNVTYLLDLGHGGQGAEALHVPRGANSYVIAVASPHALENVSVKGWLNKRAKLVTRYLPCWSLAELEAGRHATYATAAEHAVDGAVAAPTSSSASAAVTVPAEVLISRPADHAAVVAQNFAMYGGIARSVYAYSGEEASRTRSQMSAALTDCTLEVLMTSRSLASSGSLSDLGMNSSYVLHYLVFDSERLSATVRADIRNSQAATAAAAAAPARLLPFQLEQPSVKWASPWVLKAVLARYEQNRFHEISRFIDSMQNQPRMSTVRGELFEGIRAHDV